MITMSSRRIVAALSVGFISTVLTMRMGWTEEGQSSNQARPEAQPQPIIQLQHSFQVTEAEGGKDLSHMPAVVFSSDGKRLVAASSTGELLLWDTGTRKIQKRVKVTDKPSDHVSLDRDGSRAAWGVGKDGKGILLVDVQSGDRIAQDEDRVVHRVAMRGDGLAVAISRSNVIEVLDSETLNVTATVQGHEGQINHLEWSQDGSLLASTAEDGRLIVTDLETGQARYNVKKNEPLYAAAFHPKGTHVAFGGRDRKVYQYQFEGEKEEVISQQQPYWITCLGYSRSGTEITVGDESCDVWTYRIEDKKLLFHSKHHAECWLASVAWAPDNQSFLLGCRPNAQAGKPAQWAALNAQEAALSQEAVEALGSITDQQGLALQKLSEDPKLKELCDQLRDRISNRQARLAEVLKERGVKEEELKEILKVSDQTVASLVLQGPSAGANPFTQDSGAGTLLVNGGIIIAGNAIVLLGVQANEVVMFGTSINSGITIQEEATAGSTLSQSYGINDEDLKKLDEEIEALRKSIADHPEIKPLMDELLARQKKYHETVSAKAKELGSSFNVNTWQIKRK